MILVKTHVGDGRWKMFQAQACSIDYLGPHNLIAVSAGDHDYHSDQRFPSADHVHVSVEPAEVDDDGLEVEGKRHVRWVAWTDESCGHRHMLITDREVYLCNERGDTIESLR